MKLNLPGACGLYVLVWLGIVFGIGGAKATEVPFAQQAAVVMQWRQAAVDGAVVANLEVFISNMSSNTLSFTSLGLPTNYARPAINWWQFYPTSNAAPGETIAARINFGQTPAKATPLTIEAADGQTLALSAPRYKVASPRLGAITFSRNYSTIFIQYHSKKAPPRKLLLNSRAVTAFTIRRAAGENEYDLLVCEAPFPITTGQVLYLDLEFKDRTHTYALLRALNGIVLDAYSIPARERTNVVARLNLDLVPPLVEFGVSSFFGDPACYDLKRRMCGAAATNIVAERYGLYQRHRDKLSFIHFCTASHHALWDLYGAIADTALASPYCLSHRQDVARWLDNEEGFMDKARRSTQPAPWGWIPDVFRRKARFAEPDELRTLTWMALAKGCKIVKYFAWHPAIPDQAGFDECPLLAEAIAEVNKAIALKQTILAPLMPVAERIEGDPKSGLKIYTAWSGDAGLLVLVRNLDYTTDGQTNAGGAQPRFQVYVKTNLTVSLRVPDWLHYRQVTDFLTGEVLPSSGPRFSPAVAIGKLEAFRVLYLAHEPKARLPAKVEEPEPAATTVVTDVERPDRGAGIITGQRVLLVVVGLLVLVILAWIMRRRK